MQKFYTSQIFKRSRYFHLLSTPRQSKAGFTLIELLVVALLIAVLSAIAAPSWLGFVRQRRVTSANDAVVRALQEAQGSAKNQKFSYSVSFANEGGIPKVAVYRGSTTPPLGSNAWKQLGEQLSIKSGQLIIGTNLNGVNSSAGVISSASYNISSTLLPTITFDYTGGLPTNQTPNLGDGLVIAVAAPQPNTTPQIPISYTQRCVSVKTLLGSIQTGKIDSSGACNPIR